MKKIIFCVACAGLFTIASCNTSAINDKDAAIQAKQHTIDSMNIELTKKKVVDSMNELAQASIVFPGIGQQAVQYSGRAAVVSYSGRSTNHRYAGYSTTSTRGNNTVAQAPVYQQVPQRKRGWSAKAKGAVIGAGTGAIVGAVVNGRNRLAGGLIGSLLGAGAGTGIGAIIDKRNGR